MATGKVLTGTTLQKRVLYPILAAVGTWHFLKTNLQNKIMPTVGMEWLVEASGCDAGLLRDVGTLREVFARAVRELGLSVVGQPQWHKFPGEGGVTGLAMLTESHLACHTYPEFGVATFNLYCCRERPAWAWEDHLREMLCATVVSVRSIRRALPVAVPPAFEASVRDALSEGEA